ncbi:apolipoprotein N-acyltransferase [Shimia sp. NS0008-38b]|uniref:apolipoprotein N-acyltransferase n=1 Tax=Shimia sp. NS0008-38b TaxID=3127653 RepID=UPI0031080EFD
MADAVMRGRGRWGRLRPVALAIGLGGVAGLGHPPFDLWPLTLVAFAGAFALLMQTAGWRAAFWLGLSFGTGYFAVSLNWIVEPFFVDPLRHAWMAPFAIVFLSVGLSLFWAAAFALGKLLSPSAWPVVLTMTGAELVRAYILTGFPWAMPAYVLVDRMVGQVASFVGSHGLNLLFLSAALILAHFITQRGRKRGAFAVASVVALLVLGWPMSAPNSTASIPDVRPIVRLIQPNAPQHQKWDREYVGIFFERLVRFTSAGEARPDLIVWPETAVPVLLNYADESLEIIAKSARGVPVVLGLNRFEGNRLYNAAVLLDSAGSVSAIYDKHHLVPFGEYIPLGDLLSWFGVTGMASRDGDGFSAGPGPTVMDLGVLGKALLLICYEAVFPQDVRAAPERPEFILHLTNDAWFGNFSGPFQHLSQARMRAIENGLPVLRAANTGVSAAIDAHGRVLAALDLNTEGYLDVPLPEARPATLYTQSGDKPVAAIVVLLLLLTGWRKGGRMRLTPS